MKCLPVLLFGLMLVHTAQADPETQSPRYDSVSIGFIPSYGAHAKGAPFVTLESSTLAHHKDKDIEGFFNALSDLASEGRTDNATEFHQPTLYLDAVYQGERVRLFFSGDSHLDKFNRYEERWKVIYREIYDYLNSRVSPGSPLNPGGLAVAPPPE